MESVNNYYSDEDFHNEEEISSLGLKEVKKKLKRNSEECEAGFDTLEIILKIAKRGDLIEIERPKWSHWAVYDHEGMIIHLADGKNGKAVVREDLLENVLKDCKCRVNNQEKAAERKGLQPRNPDDIIREAREMIGKQFTYDPFLFNCESFATGCYFGKRFTEQGDALEGEEWLKTLIKYRVKSVMGNGSS